MVMKTVEKMKPAQDWKGLQSNQFLVHIKWSGKVTVVRLYLGRHLKEKFQVQRESSTNTLWQNPHLSTSKKVWAVRAEEVKRRMLTRVLRKGGHGHVSLGFVGTFKNVFFS